MNLQVSIPYQPCVYRCPMCVARNHANTNTFENLYYINPREWQNRLCSALKAGNYNSIVITGECDPTQDMKYVKDVINTIYNTVPNSCNIEFTTHNQKYMNCFYNDTVFSKIDVFTLSCTNVREYLNSWSTIPHLTLFKKTYRMVILLTKEFEFLTPENFNTMGFDQITFKTLQHGEDPLVNSWIDANKMDLEHLEVIKDIVDKFNSSNCSVRLDTSCQDAEGRYEIFRPDGKIYKSWEAFNGEIKS